MEQNKILIIGAGRLSLHLQHYLNIKGISWRQWTRSQDVSELNQIALHSSLACLAVKDDAIEAVAKLLPPQLPKVHFSGLLFHPEILGVHPLMTFGPELLPTEVYDQIPLIVDQDSALTDRLKNGHNPVYVIEGQNKALYHSLCHLGGNYPKLLWEEIAQTFETHLNLPRQILAPYFQQVLIQVMSGKADLQGGPFGRDDRKTIAAHRDALAPYSQLKSDYVHFYESFQSRRPL